MLNDKCTSLSSDNPSLHHLSGNNSLFRIEIGWWLINKIDITWLGESKHNSDSLQFSSWKGLDIVIKKHLNVEWSQYFSLEDTWVPTFLKLGVEQFLHGTLELGSDGLWLVTDGQLWHFNIVLVWLQDTSKHLDECGLSCSVLTEHHDDFTWLECSSFDGELESTKCFGHVRVLMDQLVVFLSKTLIVFLGVLPNIIFNLEVKLFISKTQVFSWDETG